MNRLDRQKKQMMALERRALNDDVLSAFELFKIYDNGVTEKDENGEFIQIIEINHEKADYFLDICNEALLSKGNESCEALHFSSLILTDFRKFRTLKVKLDKRLTVFIGDNGAGKTTIIDAAVKTLSWIAPNILRKNGRGKVVSEYDVNNLSQRYAEIKAKLILKKSVYESALRKNAKKSQDNIFSKIEPLEDLGELYRVLTSERNIKYANKFPLPVFLYYSVSRSNIRTNRTFDERNVDVSLDRFTSYDKKTLDGEADLNSFLEWMVVLDNLTGDLFKDKLDESRKLIEGFKLAGADAKESSLNEIYINELTKFEQLVGIVKNKEVYYKKLDFIKSCICNAMPGFENIYVDKTSGRAEVMLAIDGQKINITQASQGQQVIISLVSDIARKLLTLNPDLDNPLKSPGVVVIDEIELHLHPRWQQNIVGALLKSFECIQFIITTHSPQVLSTIDKNNIRMFINSEDGEILSVSPNFQTKGVKSADIMAKIMGADSIPDVQEARDVDNFSLLLSNNETEKAMESLNNLRKHFGKNHPVVLDCENLIKIHELKAKLKNKG